MLAGFFLYPNGLVCLLESSIQVPRIETGNLYNNASRILDGEAIMNAADHRLFSVFVLGVTGIAQCRKPEEVLPRVTVLSIGGYCGATLPDVIEPATSPNHRQFFHSLLFAAALGYGLYRLYDFEPETLLGETLRTLALIAGSAYLVHLALDATTPRSLPWVGRL
jgi:inner membrane protein